MTQLAASFKLAASYVDVKNEKVATKKKRETFVPRFFLFPTFQSLKILFHQLLIIWFQSR